MTKLSKQIVVHKSNTCSENISFVIQFPCDHDLQRLSMSGKPLFSLQQVADVVRERNPLMEYLPDENFSVTARRKGDATFRQVTDKMLHVKPQEWKFEEIHVYLKFPVSCSTESFSL